MKKKDINCAGILSDQGGAATLKILVNMLSYTNASQTRLCICIDQRTRMILKCGHILSMSQYSMLKFDSTVSIDTVSDNW